MTPEDKRLVRETFAQIRPIADQAAALFYGRLFEMVPHYRALFTHDMDEQGKKLMQMIGVAVAHLDNLGEIVPAVQALGERHVEYGVQSADYAVVGEALLWTLAQGLGDAFTAEVERAWTAVYGVLAATMQQPVPV
jgi:hemoglobin-like flavoprotein